MTFAVGSALTLLVKEGSIVLPHLGRSATVEPKLTKSSPTRPGRLAQGAGLVGAGRTILALAANGMWQSSDQGVTWTAVALPPGSTGAVVDGSDANHRLAGGP